MKLNTVYKVTLVDCDRFYEEHFTDLVKTLGMDHFHRADKEEESQNE